MEFFDIKFDESFVAATGYGGGNGSSAFFVKCEEKKDTVSTQKPVQAQNQSLSRSTSKFKIKEINRPINNAKKL